MAYPLGGSASAVGIESIQSPLSENLILEITATRTWGLALPYIMPLNSSRTVDMELITNPLFDQDPILELDAVRHWGGIGGLAVLYIPSFPQLDRQATDFPHAF